MDETYPIIFSGETTGTLTMTRRGLFTEFTARCADPGALVRLSVYGGGREGYLGVMEPQNGTLTLRRRLTRAAMEGFPPQIEYAAAAGEKPAPTGTAAPEPEPPPRPREPNTDLIWYRAGDGSLVTTWEGKQYRAVPMAAWGLPLERAVERRVIEGTEYAVFALDEAQIV